MRYEEYRYNRRSGFKSNNFKIVGDIRLLRDVAVFTHCVSSFRRSALLCEMDQRLKELKSEPDDSEAGAVALRRSLP